VMRGKGGGGRAACCGDCGGGMSSLAIVGVGSKREALWSRDKLLTRDNDDRQWWWRQLGSTAIDYRARTSATAAGRRRDGFTGEP